MAADSTSAAPRAATDVLRVRLSGPPALHARAAWALEALLARARVVDWQLVDPADPRAVVDLEWGGSGAPTIVDLPADPAAWEFTSDVAPDPARDPLAHTFWWLARVEEQLAPDDAFDEHGRFRAAGSQMVRGGDPLATPVDDLAVELATRLERWRAPQPVDKPSWRVVVTHDIDLPVRWTRSGRRRAARRVRDELRSGRIGAALRTAASLAASPITRRIGDPWDNLDRITRLERRYAARSTSYLLVGQHAPEDGDAQLHAAGAGYARTIADDRIGLHGSYTASDEPGRLEQEIEQLHERTGARPVDHRFHYLRHRPVDAWPMLDQLGLRSDSSLGFAEQPGFRAGTAHPFRAWNHAADAPLELVVIPLAVMDASFDARYLDQGRAARLQTIRRVLRCVRDAGGSASLLIHNDRLCNVDDDGWTSQYRVILSAIREHGGAACTAGDAADAYRALIPAWRRS